MTFNSDLERRGSYLVWAGFSVVFATTFLLIGFETASHFGGSAIDGAFQLYNGLRRIQGGFRPGVDFQYFHGLGIPYLHYGLYRLFGGGLRGSELAREMLTTALFPVVYLLAFRAFAGTWVRALSLTAAALAASLILNLSGVAFAINGMLGVRSALPTLIPGALFVITNGRRRTIFVGLALGVALFVSTEQGLAAVLAFVVVSMVSVLAVRRSDAWRSRTVESAATLLIAIATLVACLLVIGGFAGMAGALRYNFRLVPMDQYWFFGAPPNTFVPSWREALRMCLAVPRIGAPLFLAAASAGLCLRRVWRMPDGDVGRRNFALATLTVYGLVSCASLLGVFVAIYAQPCWRVLVVFGLLELMRMAEQFDERREFRGWLGVPRIVAVVAIVASAWTAGTATLVTIALKQSLPHVIRDHLTGNGGFSAYGMWPQTLANAQQAIDSHRGPKGELPTLWSTYAGWIEARNGVFQPDMDYIIQALGPENRRKYVDSFRSVRPQLVQTILPTYTQYESWIENNEWEFYDELLRSYTVSSTTPWSIFWERRASPGPEAQPVGTMAVTPGAASVQLPDIPASPISAATLVEVEVDYETHNPLHWLPIVGPSPRYLIGIGGAVSTDPISLSPFATRTRFPLLVAAGQHPKLFFETFSLLPGASWTPRSIRVSVRPVDTPNQVWLDNLITAFRRSQSTGVR